MPLGGRPRDGLGHKAFNLSIRRDIHEMLRKVPNRSRFIEQTIHPVLKQLDPGPSCSFLKRVDEMAKDELSKAVRNEDFEKLTTIGAMMTTLEEYRALCESPKEENCKDAGGEWENGVCILPDGHQKRKVYPR